MTKTPSIELFSRRAELAFPATIRQALSERFYGGNMACSANR
jgi:hypothetical protein